MELLLERVADKYKGLSQCDCKVLGLFIVTECGYKRVDLMSPGENCSLDNVRSMRTRTGNTDALMMVIASGRISNCILNYRIAAAYRRYSSTYAGINLSTIKVTNHELQSWPRTILLGILLGSMSSRALTRSWRPCFTPVAHGTPALKRYTQCASSAPQIS